MDRSEICSIFTDQKADDVLCMTAEIARKLTTIYENDFGYKGLYFCMIGISSPDKTACKSTESYLSNLLTELDNNSEAKEHHLSTIKSMLCATQASITEPIDEILAKCIESIEHAFSAAANDPDIKDNIHNCIDLWQRKWRDITSSV